MTRKQGLAELVASSLLFGVMATLAKKATRELDGAQVAFLRFAIGLVLTLAVVTLRRAPLRPVRKDLIFLRGLFGGFAVLLYFLALAKLPAGTATLLNYTAPVFTATFAGVFLSEQLPRAALAAMIVAGGGVAMVVVGQGRVLGGAYGWQGVALASAVCSGAAVTSIRAARRTDGPWEVFFGFCLIGLLCTAPLAIARWRTPTAHEWLLVAGVGVLSLIAQVIMTHALRAVEAATSGIIAQLTVVTTFALGIGLDHEPLTTLSLAGAVITLTGVSLAAHVSARAPSIPPELR